MAHRETTQFGGRISSGLIIIALGLLFLLQNINPDFGVWHLVGKLWPLILIGLGFYIVRSRWNLQGHGHILDGAGHSRIAGDLRLEFNGREIGDVDTSQVIGDLMLDLRGSRLRQGTNRLSVSSVIGDATLLVPTTFPLRLSAKALVGDIQFDHKTEEGLFPRIEHKDDTFDSAADKLHITLNGVTGDLSVQRV